MIFLGRVRCLVLPLLLVALAPLPGLAQTCPVGASCEGWSRDSSHREVSLSRTTLCNNGVCPAVCSTTPIVALPSIRVGPYDHVVLGFAVSDGCVPECPGAVAEPCYNLGISYRRLIDTGSEDVANTSDCDPSDPGTVVSGGASFSGTYKGGGTDNIVVSNIVYGFGIGPDDCGAPPTALRVLGTGPSLGILSDFTFNWVGSQVVGYSETRTYTNLPPPNTIHIAVSNINYGAGTYTVAAPDAVTPVHPTSWGRVKILYR